MVTAKSIGSDIEGGPLPGDDGGGQRHCSIESSMLTDPADEGPESRSAYELSVSDSKTDYFRTQTLPQIILDAQVAKDHDYWPAECGEGYTAFDRKIGDYRAVGVYCNDSSSKIISVRSWLINAPDYIELVVNRPAWLGRYSFKDFLTFATQVVETR